MNNLFGAEILSTESFHGMHVEGTKRWNGRAIEGVSRDGHCCSFVLAFFNKRNIPSRRGHIAIG